MSIYADAATDPYLGRVLTAFEGGIRTHVIRRPLTRAFMYEVTFLLQHPRVLAVAALKPPAHFHPWQEEYVEVVEGLLAVEVDGVETVLRPGDGEFVLQPWVNHRLYSPVVRDGTSSAGKLGEHEGVNGGKPLERTRFRISGQDTESVFRLDTVFFENWYAYQDQVIVKGEKIDLVQVMSMFDAGGSYLSFPWWIPFGRTISQVLGIVVGRWIGGLMGYQPFRKEWTTDWQTACRKMEMSVFQKRFSDRAKMEQPLP